MSLFHYRYLRLLVPALLIAGQLVPTFAQRPSRSPRPARVLERNIRAELAFLASDAMQGRRSASGYERIAAEYIGSQFRQFGLDPAGDEESPGNRGFVQRVPLETAKFVEPPTLTASSASESRKWQFGRDLLAPITRGARTSGELQLLDNNGAPAKGAAVVVPFAAALDQQRRQDLVRRARSAGSAMLILPESDSNRATRESGSAPLPGFPARINGETVNEQPLVMVALRHEGLAELAAMPPGTRVEFGGPTHTEEGATWNAVGVLKGSDPIAAKDAIMLSAHLDHLGVSEAATGDTIFNGADDDASGCAAVMELARFLASGKRPKRTIYFVCFGSEERGGFGAKYFVANSPVPLKHIVADITFEMLGRPDPKVTAGNLWLTGYERSNLGPELTRHGAKLVADPHPEQNFFQRSDNYTLALRGVVAHTVSSFGLHNDYHRPSDEIGKIDFRFMTLAISSLITPVRWLANSPFRPAWRPGQAPTQQ